MKNEKKFTFCIRNIKIPLCGDPGFDFDMAALQTAREKVRKIPAFPNVESMEFHIYKKSVDARRKSDIHFVYTVSFTFFDDSSFESEIIKKAGKDNDIEEIPDHSLLFPFGREVFQTRPIIVGFGPCGMFCALVLAMAGFRPIVFERGADIDKRQEDVLKFWNHSELNTESNVQFGEGGAGTFSDGKLLTRISDPLCSFVLETFHRHGAGEEILYHAKPHVGTDKLRNIVKSIRNEIISLGGEVRFHKKLTSVSADLSGKLTSVSADLSGKLTSVSINGEEMPAKALFLALGHSARDSFSMLSEKGLPLLPKSFSVGVRIEHLQSDIDRALYGENAGNPALPKGGYALSLRKNDRAVYSFCMCPGGIVVASSSEENTVVTNGMSYSSRNGINANSAIAVSVSEKDFGKNIFGAIEFQRKIEKAAFTLAGSDYAAPIQTVGSFLGNGKNIMPGRILPSYTGKTKVCDLSSLFPNDISSMLRDGINHFESKIKGFSAQDAILSAPETRTSSPVRILRDGDFCARGFSGIYPCGEGAGYAGGITSAAVDGIRAALTFMEKYRCR